ncbi:MAG TPA: AMP-dependent synthetase/ligase [Thermoanaerobaculia bacterium]|nr:AMP-dependent synthetase/ligase [Thermoanaerobaculia bacterium]
MSADARPEPSPEGKEQSIPNTIPQLLQIRAVQANPERPAFHSRVDGCWRGRSWAESWKQIRRAAERFRQLGLRKGDRLVIVARNCEQWYLTEMAGLLCGGVIVGIPPQSSAERAEYVVRHAEAKALAADSAENLEKIPGAIRRGMCFQLLFDERPAAVSGGVVAWSEVVSQSSKPLEDRQSDRVCPDDPATIIYTSGTTGPPKGIVYLHRQIMAGCRSVAEVYSGLETGDSTLCWLPMAHLFQRMVNLLAIARDAAIWFVEDPQTVSEALRDARPAVVFGVPRFFEKLQAEIHRAIPPGSGRPSEDSQRSDAVRRYLGGRVKFLVTGSAPAAPALLEFFKSAGVPLLEAYGVTENTVPISSNRVTAHRPGSVGQPLSSNEVRVASDGEVLVRGPGVFHGYYKEPMPEQQFTSDGFYRSGDLGHMDEDGFLYLEGRKSELIKTSTGHRVSPARIESAYGQSSLLDQVVVTGNGRHQLALLVALNTPAVESAFREAGMAPPPREKLAEEPAVRRLVAAEVERWGAALEPWERIRGFAILPRPLSVSEGELTANLKLRRDEIEARYRHLIERVYEEPAIDRTHGFRT